MKIYLAGPRAGTTILLQGVQFVSGIAEVRAEDEGLLKYMRRCHQAFPEGSAELEEALDKFGGRGIYHGVRNLPDNTSGNASKVQPTGKESSPKAATDKPADDSTSAGSSGSVAEGNGQKDAGVGLVDMIRKGCLQLDPDNPDHWAGSSGLPTATAMYSVCPRKDVSRKAIAKHALTREQVRKLKTG